MKADFCFTMINEKERKKIFSSIPLKFDFWAEFDFKQLTINCRQQDDKPYGEMLNRIRIGMPTVEDIKALEARFIPKEANLDTIANAVTFFIEKQKECPNLLTLFPTTQSVELFNTEMSKRKITNAYNIQAIDDNPYEKPSFKEPRYKNKRAFKAKKRKTADTAGLEQLLAVGIGSRVILKRNTNVNAGLCNGALGTVTGFNIENEETVTGILVKFDNLDHLVTIEKITSDFEFQRNIYIPRTQFPLSLAWALTIHKAQGMSLDAVLLDLGLNIFEGGQAYVALSRARKLNTVFLIDFSPHSLRCRPECIIEYNRLITKYVPGGQIIEQFNILPSVFHNLLSNKPKKLSANLINSFEKELANKYVNIKNKSRKNEVVNSKSLNQKRNNKKPFINETPQKSKKIINQQSNENENIEHPLINPLHNNNDYAMLLSNNNENSCFANSIAQVLIALGNNFANEVIHVKYFLLR